MEHIRQSGFISFLKGLTSILNIGGTSAHTSSRQQISDIKRRLDLPDSKCLEYDRMQIEGDFRVIEEDFRAIGEDFRKVMFVDTKQPNSF